MQQAHQVVGDQVEQLERIQVDLLAVAVPEQVVRLLTHLAVLALQVVCVFCGALEDLSLLLTSAARLIKLAMIGFVFDVTP